jgi:hypothetical protein
MHVTHLARAAHVAPDPPPQLRSPPVPSTAVPRPLRLLLETLRISMLGTDRRPLEELITEAASEYNASQACRTAVHSVDQVSERCRFVSVSQTALQAVCATGLKH